MRGFAAFVILHTCIIQVSLGDFVELESGEQDSEGNPRHWIMEVLELLQDVQVDTHTHRVCSSPCACSNHAAQHKAFSKCQSNAAAADVCIPHI